MPGLSNVEVSNPFRVQALGAVAQMVNGTKNSSTERKRRDFYPENKDGSRLLIGYLVNQTIGQHAL
jgi:hypothetical protein